MHKEDDLLNSILVRDFAMSLTPKTLKINVFKIIPLNYFWLDVVGCSHSCLPFQKLFGDPRLKAGCDLYRSSTHVVSIQYT